MLSNTNTRVQFEYEAGKACNIRPEPPPYGECTSKMHQPLEEVVHFTI